MATDFTVDRDTVKYVLNSSGDIASVAIDTPAIEYNTDGTYKGLLVEPASTNICLQSEDINTTWSDSAQATQAQSTEETPDGDTSNKYIRLVDSGVGGTGNLYIEQAITISASTKYTASVFVKADGLAFARLQANNYTGTNDGFQYFGLSGTGSLGTSTSLDDSSIEAYPNGWYRCSITFTAGVDPSLFTFRIFPANSISNVTVDYDGTSSIFVWGAQVEASPIATSYIPTTTASVTRNKDDISLTGASDLIGQGEGTLYVEVDWRLTTGTTQLLLSANDGTGNNRVLIYKNSSPDELRMYAEADVDIKTNQGVSSTSFSGIQKIAFAYKTDDFELYQNGSSVSSDTSGSLAALATLTDIDLGQLNDASLQANMWIRAVALYKTRLTDDQLADLTS
jgi:hypothetical protein